MRVCDFCLSSEHKVKKLIQVIHPKDKVTDGYAAHICDECVQICVQVLASGKVSA